ncbi:hypothetical protein BJY01DRAFT_261128 [Aspergillus pseudoustus]|uniref:Uncharacterized protein n=1 Tax=Aspergillus pseudoustus TaxID=1810923 RepID=A0ABR4KH16_9EURO
MKPSTILSLLPTLLSMTHALEAPIKGYRIWEPEWEVEALPGLMHKARGTIEEVHAELLHINPDWDEHYVEPALEHLTQRTSDFTKRTDFYTDGWLVCGQWPEADVPHIMSGIRYLNGVAGRPGNGPGPGNCGRVSCSYGSAIWWCNDSDQAKQLESYRSIADGAQAVLQSCSYDGGFSFSNKVTGQAFHETSWNVIVRGDEC